MFGILYYYNCLFEMIDDLVPNKGLMREAKDEGAEWGCVADETQTKVWFYIFLHHASLSSYRSPGQNYWICCSCRFDAPSQPEKTRYRLS